MESRGLGEQKVLSLPHAENRKQGRTRTKTRRLKLYTERAVGTKDTGFSQETFFLSSFLKFYLFALKFIAVTMVSKIM